MLISLNDLCWSVKTWRVLSSIGHSQTLRKATTSRTIALSLMNEPHRSVIKTWVRPLGPHNSPATGAERRSESVYQAQLTCTSCTDQMSSRISPIAERRGLGCGFSFEPRGSRLRQKLFQPINIKFFDFKTNNKRDVRERESKS